MIKNIERALKAVNITYDRLGDILITIFDAELKAYYLPVAVDISVSGTYIVTRVYLIGEVPADAMDVVCRYALEVSGHLAGAKLTVESGSLLVQAEAQPGNEPGVTALDLLKRTLTTTRMVLLETITLATDANICALVGDALAEREPRQADAPRPASDLVTVVPSSVNSSDRLDGRSAWGRVAVVPVMSDDAEA